MTLYEKIIVLINQRNTSVRAVELSAGLSIGSIARWKNGKRGPNQSTLLKVAEYFKIPVGDLLDEDWDPRNENSIKNGKVVLLPFTKLPVVDINAAGISEYVDIPCPEDESLNCFAFKMKDNSMAPLILQDDVVIARKCKCMTGDGLVVVSEGNSGITVRKYIKAEHCSCLMSLDAHSSSFLFSEKEDDEYVIQGVVTEIRRRF